MCGPPTAIRVRVMDGKANVNIKRRTTEIAREEYEYPIPLADAEEILERLCIGTVIEKKRHYVEYEGFTWEIDEYEGANHGLITAEVEMEREDQEVPIPPWVGEEVSSETRYLNSSLAMHPFRDW